MAKNKRDDDVTGELVSFQPAADVEVLPPNSGVMGKFLEDTQNMFRARSMRMKGFFNRIDKTGERMEMLLRSASECAEAAESRLEDQLRREGLLSERQPGDGTDAE